jgi:hypothetical protein
MDNIKIDLREIESVGMGWIDLALDRDKWRALVNRLMNLMVPQNVWKFLKSYTIDGFSRKAELLEVSYMMECVSFWFRWLID